MPSSEAIISASIGVSSRLQKELKKTTDKIKGAISKASANADTSKKASVRSSLFDDILNQLNKTADKIAVEYEKDLDKTSEKSAEETAKEIAKDKKNAKPLKLTREQKIVALNGYNVKKLVAVATTNMGENEIRKLRNAVVRVMNAKSIEGLTDEEIQQRLQKEWEKILKKDKNFKFVDKRGVEWDSDRYLQMLVRTNMATFARNAQLATLVGNGIDVCRISEDGGGDGDCEVCARWEGKLVSITGKTKEFPTLADAQAEGVFHPNCVHRVEYVTDDEIAKAKAEAKKDRQSKTQSEQEQAEQEKQKKEQEQAEKERAEREKLLAQIRSGLEALLADTGAIEKQIVDAIDYGDDVNADKLIDKYETDYTKKIKAFNDLRGTYEQLNKAS